ncbi:S-adenosylmethionine decarboxylase proenzyme [Xylophilus ampelinus]|nr:S-adenosylmethionine decarboxylase proenzyme [Xylophilus ampelinus]
MTRVRDLAMAACEPSGVTIVGSAFHQFEGGGVTGAVILAESDLALHTWSECGTVTLDIYVCNLHRNGAQRALGIYRSLRSHLIPAQT